MREFERHRLSRMFWPACQAIKMHFLAENPFYGWSWGFEDNEFIGVGICSGHGC